MKFKIKYYISITFFFISLSRTAVAFRNYHIINSCFTTFPFNYDLIREKINRTFQKYKSNLPTLEVTLN